MRNAVVVFGIIMINNCALGQKLPGQIEINPYLRWDNYPKFVYSVNPVNTNTVRIKGTSWGVNAAYKFPVRHKFFIKAGFGYYKYSFNNIDQLNSLFGKSNSRIINYTPPGGWSPAIMFSTNRYWYNSIAATIGIEKHIDLAKGFLIVCGADIRNYYTFSQQYPIVSHIPEGINYERTNSRYFGFSANLNAGLQKKFGKISVGPAIFFPVYDLWKQDEVFPQEQNKHSRDKWLKGFGAGISCSYSLIKKL